MLYRANLRKIAVAALKSAGTMARQSVFSPQDWPTFSGNYPAILVQTPRERKESIGRGMPQFTVTTTMSVIGRLDGTDAEYVETQLELLCEQIEQAILTNYDLVRLTQQFSAVDTRMEVSCEGEKHIGEVQIDFSLEFYQAFEPTFVDALTEADVHVDLVGTYDAAGTYPSPPFPTSVQPAPRTSGPDGRDEGRLQIILPQ
jgi:hypothetical protein